MKHANQQLARLDSLVSTKDSRAPMADVSNAPHLMGDPYEGGDVYEGGDPDDSYGDPDDSLYGDVSTAGLDTYNTLIGDVEEQGAPFLGIRIPKFKNWSKGAKIGTGVAAAGALGFGTVKLIQALKRRKQRRAAVAANLAQNSKQATIANQVRARRLMGAIPRTSAMPFYQITGATLNSYPLSPTEAFAADTLKYNFDRQSTDTPFEVEIVNGTFAGVTWTLTANGVVATRFYTCVFIVIGISVLTANPGTIFNVVGTMPTFNGGSLVISTNPFSFTLRQGYYAKFLIFPWQLVTNKPLLALGSYDNANPIVFNITGLPSNAAVSMVVPGSQHPWTIAMRNRLII